MDLWTTHVCQAPSTVMCELRSLAAGIESVERIIAAAGCPCQNKQPCNKCNPYEIAVGQALQKRVSHFTRLVMELPMPQAAAASSLLDWPAIAASTERGTPAL